MQDETTQPITADAGSSGVSKPEPIAETPVSEPRVEVPIQTEGLASTETAPEAVGALGGSNGVVVEENQNEHIEGGERSEPPCVSPISSPVTPVSSTQTEIPPTSQNTSDSVSPTSVQGKTNLKSLFAKLKEKLSFRTEKRLAKIMEFAREKSCSKGHIARHDIAISNDEVEKLLHVSDASASNYLNKLVKRGQLQVSGPKNHSEYSLN
jgi:hypothetical protein